MLASRRVAFIAAFGELFAAMAAALFLGVRAYRKIASIDAMLAQRA